MHLTALSFENTERPRSLGASRSLFRVKFHLDFAACKICIWLLKSCAERDNMRNETIGNGIYSLDGRLGLLEYQRQCCTPDNVKK